MKKWTRPVFEAFEVNGEATAYAGAVPGDAAARRASVGEDGIAAREAVATEPAPGTGPTEGPRRGAV
jgi:hypothetical protein